ncbi:MAG: hypothetical protein ABSG01_13505 [Anaerolineales bacterium]|jgi:hypothetical protein
MKTLLFLTADYANLTLDNKVNILGIFNQVFAMGFPTLVPQFHLVAKVGLEPGEEPNNRKLTLYLVGEDANAAKVKIFEQTFNFPERLGGLDPEHAIIIALQGMVFPKKGTYQFLLHLDDRFLASLSLYLREQQPPQPQPQLPQPQLPEPQNGG